MAFTAKPLSFIRLKLVLTFIRHSYTLSLGESNNTMHAINDSTIYWSSDDGPGILLVFSITKWVLKQGRSNAPVASWLINKNFHNSIILNMHHHQMQQHQFDLKKLHQINCAGYQWQTSVIYFSQKNSLLLVSLWFLQVSGWLRSHFLTPRRGFRTNSGTLYLCGSQCY